MLKRFCFLLMPSTTLVAAGCAVLEETNNDNDNDNGGDHDVLLTSAEVR